MDEWIKKMCIYIYAMEILATKKNEILASDSMDTPKGYYAKGNKLNIEQVSCDTTYTWNLKRQKK